MYRLSFSSTNQPLAHVDLDNGGRDALDRPDDRLGIGIQ
jgi:hypothetical protein